MCFCGILQSYRYEKFSGVPEHIKQTSAEAYLPHARMKSIYDGGKDRFMVETICARKRCNHSPLICLIADCLRFRYAESIEPADFDKVCIADCDCTWLRDYDDTLGHFGFQFASVIENSQSYENKDYVSLNGVEHTLPWETASAVGFGSGGDTLNWKLTRRMKKKD